MPTGYARQAMRSNRRSRTPWRRTVAARPDMAEALSAQARVDLQQSSVAILIQANASRRRRSASSASARTATDGAAGGSPAAHFVS